MQGAGSGEPPEGRKTGEKKAAPRIVARGHRIFSLLGSVVVRARHCIYIYRGIYVLLSAHFAGLALKISQKGGIAFAYPSFRHITLRLCCFDNVQCDCPEDLACVSFIVCLSTVLHFSWHGFELNLDAFEYVSIAIETAKNNVLLMTPGSSVERIQHRNSISIDRLFQWNSCC